jgi:hypothetical protein
MSFYIIDYTMYLGLTALLHQPRHIQVLPKVILKDGHQNSTTLPHVLSVYFEGVLAQGWLGTLAETLASQTSNQRFGVCQNYRFQLPLNPHQCLKMVITITRHPIYYLGDGSITFLVCMIYFP